MVHSLLGATVLTCLAGPWTAPTATRPTPAETARYQETLRKARRFLDALRPKMDPVVLRTRHQMKGKKYFVEYLNAYLVFYRRADESERQAIRQWLSPLVAVTQTDAYHDLARADWRRFKQDVISYLNACRILELFGFDTERYRREIRKILPRILSPEHLRRRGIDNTMAITFQLDRLGFGGGPDLCELYQRDGCVVRTHPDLTRLNLDDPMQRTRIYDLTHEIFFLTGHGARPIQCANQADLRYIRRIHARLIPMLIAKQNPDLVGELLMDLNYLNMRDLAAYGQAYRYLLSCQNADGSWCHQDFVRYVRSVMRPGYLIDVGQYLHTTQVVLRGLSGVFDRPASTQPSLRPSDTGPATCSSPAGDK